MFKSIYNHFNKQRLKDARYLWLFDKPIEDEFVCFDCETTGLDVRKDEIVSIGAVKIKNNTIRTSEQFVRFLKPKAKMQIDAIKVHHIREVDLMHGKDMDEVLREFLDFIGNRVLVGYFLEFDMAMINRYLKPSLGITLPNKTIEVSALYYDHKIETIPQGHVDLRFDTMIRELKIPHFGKHDALNDAIMTSMMFLKLHK